MSAKVKPGGPSFSVVINTLNRAELLDDAIRGVLQLDYPDFELIVVNGPSTDRSEEVLDGWSGRIKHLRCAEANLSISRNVGIAAASGDIVAFLDDDAVPHPAWLAKLARNYGDARVGGVGGYTVDNTGMRWQVRKTVCDRFGDAHFVDDFFDERRLNFPGSPFYPSLLGTNSSFRRAALLEIGGFDHTFAYLLDETDVCLRLVDAGWKVLYEPKALVFHQFAESHIRTVTRKPKTLYPSAVSKTYFISRHGQAEGFGEVARALDGYREELFRANTWLADHGDISPAHRDKLDSDVELGTRDGIAAHHRAAVSGKSGGDLVPAKPTRFLASGAGDVRRIVLVSQGLPPENEAGIARWTAMLAGGLRDLGMAVHVITRAKDEPSRRFQRGIWYHKVCADPSGAAPIAARYALPQAVVADWMAAVMREIEFIKTFGLDLVSFPIWDLEALPVLDDPDVASVISLHTSYQLARPFKPEWNTRIIYGRGFVDRMIAGEYAALSRAPAILANSTAIVREIERAYGVTLAERAEVVPHGTANILAELGQTLEGKLAGRKAGAPLRVLMPGRFEQRKGIDLALALAASLAGNVAVQFDFVGENLGSTAPDMAHADFAIDVRGLGNCIFHGQIDRDRLQQLYAQSDVVLMPSRFESFGLVAIEGMSAGSPVIALNSGGLAEVIEHGESGWLFDEASFVGDAAQTITRLSHDRALLSDHARKAYIRFGERYSIAAMAKGVAAFYQRAIAAKAGANP